jgi:hypothetical protein
MNMDRRVPLSKNNTALKRHLSLVPQFIFNQLQYGYRSHLRYDEYLVGWTKPSGRYGPNIMYITIPTDHQSASHP